MLEEEKGSCSFCSPQDAGLRSRSLLPQPREPRCHATLRPPAFCPDAGTSSIPRGRASRRGYLPDCSVFSFCLF